DGDNLRALGLRARAREAVEDVAAAGCRHRDRVAHDADHRLVGNEITACEAGGNFLAELAARRDVRPQPLTTRDGADPQTGGEDLAVRALARAGSAEKNDTHGACSRGRLVVSDQWRQGWATAPASPGSQRALVRGTSLSANRCITCSTGAGRANRKPCP